MNRRIRVGATSEFDDADRKIVDTEVGEIGVVRVGGEFYAVRNRCPHRGGPVCSGKVTGALGGDWPGPGERIDEGFEDEPAITCPWHGWDFYLSTGDHVGDDSVRVPTYDVTVEDGTVFVEV